LGAGTHFRGREFAGAKANGGRPHDLMTHDLLTLGRQLWRGQPPGRQRDSRFSAHAVGGARRKEKPQAGRPPHPRNRGGGAELVALFGDSPLSTPGGSAAAAPKQGPTAGNLFSMPWAGREASRRQKPTVQFMTFFLARRAGPTTRREEICTARGVEK